MPMRSGAEATDDATLVKAVGGTTVVGRGRAMEYQGHRTRRRTGRCSPTGGPLMSMRIGHAFDIHPFSDDADRVLVLGGVTFPGETALHGHSDADVIAHACIDAILSPAGLGDIGQLFPDTDASLAGADSMVLLAEALRSTARDRRLGRQY